MNIAPSSESSESSESAASASGTVASNSESGDVRGSEHDDGVGRDWSWDDGGWMRARAGRHGGDMPLAFYRLNAADWHASRFTPPLDWNRLAQELVPYVADLGFTHIALDEALAGEADTVVCRFVETCHVAGVGVIVVRPDTFSSEADFLAWCQRCHIDGFEDASGGTLGGDDANLLGDDTSNASHGHDESGCRLFRDDTTAPPLMLHRRPKWQLASASYLALAPAERCERHADWVEALTPRGDSRGLLEQVPDNQAALGQWRQRVHGDDWQRFAAFRACLALMWALPGDKQVAMGVELGQLLAEPWEEALHWPLLFESRHAGILRLVADLNRLYVNEPALQIRDEDRQGFEWLIDDDSDNCVIVFARHAESGHASMICLCNFQSCVHYRYRLGVPAAGWWRETFNSDSVFYGGSNVGNGRGATTQPIPSHAYPQSLAVTVPPMAALFLRHENWSEDTP